jgi:hypothetical protein
VLRAVTGTGTRAQPWGNWKGGQHPSETAQSLRQGDRTSPKTPDTNYYNGVQSCKTSVVCFSPAVRESKHLYWTVSRERCRKVQGTRKHATMLPAHQKNFHKALEQCILCVHWWHAGVLKSASVRAMGRLPFGPGHADGALIQVACSIYQGYTSRFLGYISKATMLLVSESGTSRKK